MAKPKYYVVWSGKQTGIFTTWDACKQQVHGVQGARYKSYATEALAKVAFENGSDPNSVNKKTTKKPRKQSSVVSEAPATFIIESISVDAACSGNPGDMEYRGVHTENAEEIFHYGPVPNGTNNIGEFLAIVHALALLKKTDNTLPIYSDSVIAMGWVRKKKANTTIPRDASTAPLWDMIERAEKWLRDNRYPNHLLKWETKQWGEIKADFGRK